MKFSNYLLLQHRNDSCGLAAIQTLISYVHKDKSYLKVRLAKNVNNFLTMIQIASRHNITLEARKVQTVKALRHEKGVLLLQLKTKDMAHFVTAKRFGKSYMVNDPNGSSYFVNERTLAKYFSLHYLAVKDFKRKKFENAPKIKVNNFLLYVLNALFLCSLILAFYFMGNEHFALFTYLLVAFSFVIYVFEKMTRLLLFKKFDERVIAPNITNEHVKTVKDFELLMKAKTSFFLFKFEKYAVLLNIIFIATILVINGPLFIIIVMSLMILAITEHLVISLTSDRLFNLTQQEKELYRNEQKELKELYNVILEQSTFLAARQEITRIIFYFLVFGLAFLVMAVAGNFTLNFFLFYFFIFIYLFEEAKKLLKLRENQRLYYLANFLINDLR